MPGIRSLSSPSQGAIGLFSSLAATAAPLSPSRPAQTRRGSYRSIRGPGPVTMLRSRKKRAAGRLSPCAGSTIPP
jgi:hypothetical protein